MSKDKTQIKNKNSIKIAMILASFPKLSETFIVNKFIGLLKEGKNVYVICRESKKEEKVFFPELKKWKKRTFLQRVRRSYFLVGIGALVAFMRSLVGNFKGTLKYIFKGYKKFGIGIFKKFYLDSEIIRLNPDIIHFEFGSLAVERMYLKELLGCKIAVSFRGYDINYIGLSQKDYYKEVWKETDILHFLGNDLWQRALNRGCPSSCKHVFIPPAVEKDFFDLTSPEEGIRDRNEDTLNILSVGRLEWKKGYKYGLSAIKLLVDKGIKCKYRIIGDGMCWGEISFQIHELGLGGVVQLLGQKNPECIKDYLKKVDIFLHSAVSEGFCNAVLEAQAAGVPVVCTDADGLSENVKDKETGFVVERRNPRALAEKIEILINNKLLRKAMGKKGRIRAENSLSLEAQIESFGKMYESINL